MDVRGSGERHRPGAAGRARRAAPGAAGGAGRARRAAGGGGAAEFPGAASLRAHWPAPLRDVTLGEWENPACHVTSGAGPAGKGRLSGVEGPDARRCPVLGRDYRELLKAVHARPLKQAGKLSPRPLSQ